MNNGIDTLKDIQSELSSYVRKWNREKEKSASNFQRYVEDSGYGNAIAWYADDVVQAELVSEKLVDFQELVLGTDDPNIVSDHIEIYRTRYLDEIIQAPLDSSEASHRLVNHLELQAYKILHEIFKNLAQIFER